jgi:hypothetical protein
VDAEELVIIAEKLQLIAAPAFNYEGMAMSARSSTSSPAVRFARATLYSPYRSSTLFSYGGTWPNRGHISASRR